MADIHDIATELAKFTNEQWEATPGNHENVKYISRVEDDLTFMFYRDHGGKGTIRLNLTPGQFEAQLYSEKTPNIGNSWDKNNATRVARDIVNRLMGDAKAMHDELNERSFKQLMYENRTKFNEERLAANTEVEFHNGTGQSRLIGRGIGDAWARDIRVSGDSVSMELNSLTPEQAIAVLQVIEG